MWTIIAIVVVIILLYLLLPSAKNQCLKKLDGLWVADDDFCIQSDIEMMSLYFGKHEDGYLCWILIVNKLGNFNHITHAKITGGTHIKKSQYEFDLDFDDIPDNMFSNALKIRIVPGELITLYDPETDAKIFEGVKNQNASKAIEFKINNIEDA